MSMLKSLRPTVYNAIRSHGAIMRPAGDQWMVSCPVHEDSTPSVAVKEGDDGKVLVYDHGGCSTDDIIAAWGLTMADMRDPDSTPKAAAPHHDTWTPEGPASDIYDYTDEHGELLYQVMRVPKPGGKKTFRQRRPDTTTRTGWAWNLKGVRRVPYRLPQTLEAIQNGRTVWCVEGERDVHTLETHGHTATCNSGGAGKWDPEFCDWFADGARVIIIADADQPGREHARKIYHQMQEVGANVTLTEPAEGCKDITEHINAGLPLGDLLVIEQPPVPDYGLIDIHTLVNEEEEPYHWLIPDLIEHNERLMITGGEGSGKSTMLRQIAIMTAAGIHPFPHTADRTIRTFDPKKVLWVDAENSRRQNRRQLTPLYHLTQSLGQQIPPGHFTIALRPEGLDLHKGDDHVWLQERVAITKPDLLIIGPWYRLFNGDPNDETAARQVIQVIDTLRAQYNFTTIMEAHSPHQPPGAKHRPLRPIGSSILLRWPEYGYGLQFHMNPDTQLTDRSYADFIPWRGDRDERSWPAAFTRGTLDGDPPWLATDPKTPDDPRPERDHQTRRDTQYAYSRGNGGSVRDVPKPRMADQ